MTKDYHSIIVNREVSKSGRWVWVPYCFCQWKGKEFYTVIEASRYGEENHIEYQRLYPKGRGTT